MFWWCYLYISGSACNIYSSVVSQYWNPDDSIRSSSELKGFTCYSSWHKRNDIAGIVNITGTAAYSSARFLEYVNDGYFCSGKAYYYQSKNGLEGWMEIDLNKLYSLKCIKVLTVKYFDNIEFRFGNYSKDQGLSMNEIIFYQETSLDFAVFEYCLTKPLIGQYIHIESKKVITPDYISIGEIQILVE